MFKTIVWATDGSELADVALDHVRELAQEDGSRIVAVHANELMRGRPSGYPALADEPELEEKIEKQIEELRSVGIDATLEVRSGNKGVATLIAEAADEVDADLIVVATHGARRSHDRGPHGQRRPRPLPHGARRRCSVIPPVRKPEQEAAKDDRLAAV